MNISGNDVFSILGSIIKEIERGLEESEKILKDQASEESKLRINSIVIDLHLEYNITPQGFDLEATKKMLGL